ncbi:MAG: hypothetical protein ACM3PU_18380 [Gemmatimonadota bacterium]
MKFTIWLVVEMALMPPFVLFAGLSAAGALRSPVELDVTGIFLAAAVFAGAMALRALRRPDRDGERASGP